MQYGNLPRVRDSVLQYNPSGAGEQTPVLVGSAKWYQMLEQLDGFGFEDQNGRSFTARREQRQQQSYWYAYRKRGKKLRKVYLGKTEQLQPARLQAAARELAEPLRDALSDTPAAPHSPAHSPNLDPLAGRFLHPAKLHVPATPTALLPRPRLTRLLRSPLQAASPAPGPFQRRPQTVLTLLTAPAGYGKTTLLSEWLHQVSNLGVAWLSLDPEDNDPQRFWRYVVAALQSSAPEVGREALAFLQDASAPAIDQAVIALLDALRHTTRPLVLVLDDYHAIDAPAIHSSLAALLTNCPPCLHVVISSQTRSPLPLGRLRLRFDVTEIQTADLRLTHEEGAALLNQDPRLAGNPQAIAAVLRKTEGWAAGVSLFSVFLQQYSDLETALAEFDGTHHYLREYVVESVWRHQSPAIQTFLLHTSILNQLSGPLCEAVTALPNGQHMLARLEQANLFLVALEQRPGHYRYHQLFAQVLRGMLEQMCPDDVLTLHRRAAGWYLEQQAPGDALHHLLAGCCWLEAAEVLEQHALSMLKGGDVARLLRVLRQLPQEVLHLHPALLVVKARALMLVGELNALDSWLDYLEAGDAPAAVLEEVARIRVVVGARVADGASTVIGEGTVWESLDAFTRSMQYWSHGDIEASRAAAAQAIRAGQTSGFRSVSLMAAGTTAMIHIARGELRAALRVAHDGLALAHTTEAAILSGVHHPSPAATPILLALGVIAYERNGLEQAQRCLEQALTLGERLGREDYLFSVRMYLARTLAARDQRQEAQALVQTAASRAREGRIAFWPEADVLAYQAWFWQHMGDSARATRWVQVADVRVDDPQIAQRRIEYWAYGEILLAQGQYTQAASILGHLAQSATQVGTRTEPLIKLLVAHASALFAQGQRGLALPVLERALSLGQEEGYIRPFLDDAAGHSRALLEHYHQKVRAEAHIEQYMQQLLAESAAAPLRIAPRMDGTTTAATLSRREREILRLVEGGLSNLEIAHKLVIEGNTVKSHLHRIYQRLGATTRYEAVKHAKALQLL